MLKLNVSESTKNKKKTVNKIEGKNGILKKH